MKNRKKFPGIKSVARFLPVNWRFSLKNQADFGSLTGYQLIHTKRFKKIVTQSRIALEAAGGDG